MQTPKASHAANRWLFEICILHFALLLSSGCARAPATLTPSRPDPLQQLRNDITAVTGAPGVARAAWGIVVESLDRKERLFELNPRALLVPASTAKLIALAGAADAVGWDFRYETRFRGTGSIVDGVLQGNLVVAGTGDPSMGGRGGMDLTPIVDAIARAGVRRIDGTIVGDDDAIDEPRPQLAWAWDDLGYATGALFGALNLGENRMPLVVSPGAAEGERTVVLQPYAWGRPIRNLSMTGAAQSMPLLWPEQRPGEPFLTIAGSIPVGAPPTRMFVSVGNPTLWFARALRQTLIEKGIEVAGEAADIDDIALPPERSGADLYVHRSPALAELAQPMIKDSINLYGEAALRLNSAPSVFPTNDAALAGLRQRLAAWGVADGAWQIVDGSGLSRRNAVAPEVLVAVLQRMYDASGASPWMTALPLAGRDGTLTERMRGTAAEGNVRAKTGTMSNIRTLAGYVRTRDGEMLVFAIMANNFEGAGGVAVEAIDRIAVRLAEFTRAR
jgi:D-alanyl-D-alanine carboxypeptidase/D-alanyl-D-alanine-endopeptidase (penicillin-binding protein 4)